VYLVYDVYYRLISKHKRLNVVICRVVSSPS